MSHVPMPEDFVSPGDHNDPARIKGAAEGGDPVEAPPEKRKLSPQELADAIRRVEPDGSAGPDPFEKGPIPERARNSDEPQGQPQDPQAPSEPVFQPIKELGRDLSETFHIVVPDARPHVTVPLTGPGAYEITVK